MIWKADYAIGIPNIDQQHKQIVGLITMYEELSADEAKWHELHPLVQRTREFMEFHFCVEESLMRLLPYPDRDAHRAEHQRQLQHILYIEQQALRGNMHAGLAPLMRDCLFGHIVHGDKRLAQFALRQFGRRPSREGHNSASSGL